MSGSEEPRPVFGERRPDTAYRRRPGVYAVVLDGPNVLVVDAPAGTYLPGGGLETGETELAGLRRELREETGHELAEAIDLGLAHELIITRAAGEPIEKVGRFFAVQLADGPAAAVLDDDHVTRWVTVGEALATLAEGSHRWAVGRAHGARLRRA